MNIRLSNLLIFMIIMSSCRQSNGDIRDYVDHWEITRTICTYNNSSLNIDAVENKFELIKGLDQVFIITIESKAIPKDKDKVPTDLNNSKSLLI